MKRFAAAAAAITMLLTGCTASAEEAGPALTVANGYVRATDMMSEMDGDRKSVV